jgi:hypothetical protein
MDRCEEAIPWYKLGYRVFRHYPGAMQRECANKLVRGHFDLPFPHTQTALPATAPSLLPEPPSFAPMRRPDPIAGLCSTCVLRWRSWR